MLENLTNFEFTTLIKRNEKNEEGGQFSNQYFAIVCSACCVCQIVKDLFRIEEKTPARSNVEASLKRFGRSLNGSWTVLVHCNRTGGRLIKVTSSSVFGRTWTNFDELRRTADIRDRRSKLDGSHFICTPTAQPASNHAETKYGEGTSCRTNESRESRENLGKKRWKLEEKEGGQFWSAWSSVPFDLSISLAGSLVKYGFRIKIWYLSIMSMYHCRCVGHTTTHRHGYMRGLLGHEIVKRLAADHETSAGQPHPAGKERAGHGCSFERQKW